ncbi:hypothetical protein MHYP_G00118950 [Metynnis hypsauchen]
MASYTVVMVPLRSGINSLDALRFFLWVKNLQELERERDTLWMGLQALEQARAWLCCRLEENKQPWESEEPRCTKFPKLVQETLMDRFDGPMMSRPDQHKNVNSLFCRLKCW